MGLASRVRIRAFGFTGVRAARVMIRERVVGIHRLFMESHRSRRWLLALDPGPRRKSDREEHRCHGDQKEIRRRHPENRRPKGRRQSHGLQNEAGETRFVSHDGAHRLGILSALGFQHAIVEVDLDRFPVVHESEVENWTYVKSGLLRKAEALRIFQLYFTLDGTERLRHLG